MAAQTPVNSAVEQLMLSLMPKNSTAPKLRRSKDTFNRRLKIHNYGRTNQFEVIERLDGLEEKFQVLNRDDLSDALHTRRNELRKHEQRFLPDVLDLLLRLSVDPANLTRSDGLERVEPRPASLPPLRWADVEESDPIDYSDPIWQAQDYSDFSSDNDVHPGSSQATSPQSVKEIVGREALGPKVTFSKFEPEEKCLNSFAVKQVASFGEQFDAGTVIITELQATREALMMLQGLPTMLYLTGDDYEPDKRFSLHNVNRKIFQDVLRSYGQIGQQVSYVRAWLKTPQKTQYMRTMHILIESRVRAFDAAISNMQQDILRPKLAVHLGLLPTLEAARSKSALVKDISLYLKAATTNNSDAVVYLDTLFDTVCAEQAAGEIDRAKDLLDLLVPTLQVYLRPVEHWMRNGEIHPNLEPIFIVPNKQRKELSTLWRDWFSLAQERDKHQAPRFLRPCLPEILAVGKTSLYLQHLKQPPKVPLSSFSGLFDESKKTLSSACLPFSESLASSLETTIKIILDQASESLYQELDQQCGLLAMLDVLGCVYFGKRGPITDNIDGTLFRRIDKCNTSWSDRFLLFDVLQTAFSEIPGLDVSRLVVHASHTTLRNIQNRRKSVKILGDLSVEYNLPWQSSNIIAQSSLVSYRRVALFLMQIRRARYSLERRAHFYVMNPKLGVEPNELNSSRALYQRLLLFVNTVYNHLTTLVIDESTTSMQSRMKEARRVDEMAAIHSDYTKKLEKACITSKNLKPIRDTIISILDLCVRFSDVLTSTPGRGFSDADTNSYKSAASRLRKKDAPGGLGTESEEGEDDESSDERGYSTFIILEEPSAAEEFKKMNSQLTRHLAFVVAGLQSVGRVEEGSSWAILAGRLN